MNKIKFKTRKETTEFLKTKGIDTTDWSEEKWQSINNSQAEIHIQALAEAMWDAKNESTPNQLKAGEWHIPFGDKIDSNKLGTIIRGLNPEKNFPIYAFDKPEWKKLWEETKLKISTARAARLSYMTFDGEIDYEKDIKLHDQLLESKHMSPFEHCAKVMSDEEYYSFIKGEVDIMYDGIIPIMKENSYGWCNNFRGFIPYRYLVENEKSISENNK